MVMSRDRTQGKIATYGQAVNSFETVEQFKYLGTIITSQNSIYEEIKSRLKSGNACYHSAESFVFQFAIQKCKD
jgi:hypothetical protein